MDLVLSPPFRNQWPSGATALLVIRSACEDRAWAGSPSQSAIGRNFPQARLGDSPMGRSEGVEWTEGLFSAEGSMTKVASTSTSPDSRSLLSRTIARRSLWSVIVGAVVWVNEHFNSLDRRLDAVVRGVSTLAHQGRAVSDRLSRGQWLLKRPTTSIGSATRSRGTTQLRKRAGWCSSPPESFSGSCSPLSRRFLARSCRALRSQSK